MGKFSKKMKKKYNETNKKSIVVYLSLRVLVVISMIIQILLGNIENAVICIVALFLFTIPTIISEKLKIGIPSLLEAIIYLFIFSATILGEINNFYFAYIKWIFMCRNRFLISRLAKSK